MRKLHRVISLLQPNRGIERGLLKGIAKYTMLNGAWTFYRRPQAYQHTKTQLETSSLEAWKPTGAIVPFDQIDLVSELNIPIITCNIDEYTGPIPSVDTEHFEAGKLAAEHLIATGHRHFAYCGYTEIQWSMIRCKGFQEVIEKAGFEMFSFQPTGKARLPWARQEERLKDWIDSLPKPVGMLCANDDRAETMMEICRAQGYAVPEDISIIGVDDDQYICELQNPPISSVRMASELAGYQAASLLDQLMLGKEQMSGQRIIAKAVNVTARQSTTVLMVDDPEVRKALQFVRENADRPVQVSDVVKATSLSHRALNVRFRASLNCSINTQMTRSRIGYISRLLTETDLRIFEIADISGYDDDRHISRYFKRATGMTPQAYRRKYTAP